MGGESDDVCHADGVGMHAAGDQPGHVGGVEEKQGADLVSDAPDRGRIDDPGVGGGPGDDAVDQFSHGGELGDFGRPEFPFQPARVVKMIAPL